MKFFAAGAAILALSSGFASLEPTQPCLERGMPINPSNIPAAYNEAAGLESALSFSGSFIYWLAVQDNMQIAYSNALLGVGTISAYPVGSETLIADTAFTPGFKIGVEGKSERDHWRISGEYTRLHGSTFTSALAPVPPAGANGTVGVWSNAWFLNTTNTTSRSTAFHWKYEFDIGDLQLSRRYYAGKNLVLEPFGGLRTAWIRQKVRATISQVVYTSGISNVSGSAYGLTRCWSVGPKIGLNGRWEIPLGWRVICNGYYSLLYAEYPQFSYSVDNIDGFSNPGATGIRYDYGRYSTLIPNGGLAFGFGWGSDWIDSDFNLDFSLSYEFNVFWNQNLFRKYTSVTPVPQSNLYLHGLTATGRFDF